ncbi:unnamed protein product [Agarophyton chilense]
MNLTNTRPILLLIAAFVLGYAESMHFERAIFKSSYVLGEEKVQRVRLSSDRDSLQQVATPHLEVAPDDSLACQVSFQDNQKDPAAPNQVLFRFENKKTGKDNYFLMKKKGRDFKVDIKLSKEIKGDLEFWQKDGSYRAELIMGDPELDLSQTWTITDKMTFSDKASALFKEPERGVFDFDVSVKKYLLPEFISPTPAPEKRAHPLVVVGALIGVTLPSLLLLYVWIRMGVFPLSFKDKNNVGVLIGFEACVLGHIVALVMFWVKWNIVVTWKVMAALMIPTCILGRQLLLENTGK